MSLTTLSEQPPQRNGIFTLPAPGCKVQIGYAAHYSVPLDAALRLTSRNLFTSGRRCRLPVPSAIHDLSHLRKPPPGMGHPALTSSHWAKSD